MTNSSRKVFNIIMALLVSIGAWMFVVYNYYPMTDVTYHDVPLRFEGQKELASRGLAVSEASTEGITVKLNQRRVNYNNYAAKDIKVTVNVSECVAGENSVSLNVSGPKDTSVISHDTDAVKVMVERIDSVYSDIDVIYSEGAADNEEPIVIDMGRERAEAVCASSKIGSIDKVAAVLEHSEVSEDVKSFTAKLVALDKEGNIVPYAVIYPDEISLDAGKGYTKIVDFIPDVKNEKSEDYDRKYTSPDKITIKGSEAAISKLTSITTEEVDLNQYYESGDVPLECILPDGIYLSKSVDPEKLALKLVVTKIEKEETKEDEN